MCHVCAAAVALFQYMLVPASSADRAVHDRISRISQGTASAMKRVKPWLRPSSSTPPWPTWTSMVCSVLCCHLSPSFQGWARCVASWFQGTTCVLVHPSLPSPLAPHWARKEGGLIMVTHAAPLPAPASPLPHWVPQPAFLRQQHRSSRGSSPGRCPQGQLHRGPPEPSWYVPFCVFISPLPFRAGFVVSPPGSKEPPVCSFTLPCPHPSPLTGPERKGGLIMFTHAAPLPAPASPLPHWVTTRISQATASVIKGVRSWPMPSRSTPPWPT